MGFSDFLPVCLFFISVKEEKKGDQRTLKASMIKAGDQLGNRALGITQP